MLDGGVPAVPEVIARLPSLMQLVTQTRLDHASYAVTSELDRLGFYDRHVQAVETRLVRFGGPYGWPRVSWR
jgi:hypothetical protein